MLNGIHPTIDLLQAGEIVYYDKVKDLTFDNGIKLSKGWADLLVVDFEHSYFDIPGLQSFMEGLRQGGPTPNLYQTPTVISTLPSNCRTRAEVESNAWQIRHVFSTGVHGILHTHCQCPEAVQAYIEACRYSFQKIGVGPNLGPGNRGSGNQEEIAKFWGISKQKYLKIADPWPLNSEGTFLLGIKIETRKALDIVNDLVTVPGLSIAEWGPGDMSMSFGYPDNHDPPYPPKVETARKMIKRACDRTGLQLMSSWNDQTKTIKQNLQTLFDWGIKIVACPSLEIREIGLHVKPRKSL